MVTLEKKDLIDSIMAWEPSRHRGILEGLDVATLKNILAEVAETFVNGQQERILQAQADVAVTRFAHELRIRETRKPIIYAERQALEKDNRAVFMAVSKQLGFSGIEANYSLLVDALGELTSWGIQKWISERPETLVPASEAEIEQRRLEAITAHNNRLLNASPIELRQAVKAESEQRRTGLQQAEIQRRIKTQDERDNAIGFDPIPTHNADGQAIDRAYLLRLADSDIKLYRKFCTRYGSANVTARLNGVR